MCQASAASAAAVSMVARGMWVLRSVQELESSYSPACPQEGKGREGREVFCRSLLLR